MARRRHSLLAIVAVMATLALGGCGGGERHVALAIQTAERSDGAVVLTVECATDLEVERAPDPEGSGLVQVTVWGDPANGTCDPQVELDDLDQEKFVDGASSQVVTVATATASTG